MFVFPGAPVQVRADLRYAYINTWAHFARPGPTLTGHQRLNLLAMVREANEGNPGAEGWWDENLGLLAATLYSTPNLVNGDLVAKAISAVGDAQTVETIAIVSMLASIDGTHRALGAEAEPLPTPEDGTPTGKVTAGLKRRRAHVPMPPGPIPSSLDLLPDEGAAFQALFGPQYMTNAEMMLDDFRRMPGLNRAQMELISTRTSVHNECFY